MNECVAILLEIARRHIVNWDDFGRSGVPITDDDSAAHPAYKAFQPVLRPAKRSRGTYILGHNNRASPRPAAHGNGRRNERQRRS